MFCSKCGHELDSNNLCPNINCSSNTNTDSNDSINNSYNKNYNNEYDTSNEFSYEDVTATNMTDFIGVKNTEYYMEKWTRYQENPNFISWNWPAFFFGFLWFAYRKMYGYAAIIWGVSFVLGLIDFIPSSLVSLVIMISSGLLANQLYIKSVIKNIKKILYSIPGMLDEDIRRRLVANGGTTWVPVIIVSIIMFLLIIVGIIAGIAFASSYRYFGY